MLVVSKQRVMGHKLNTDVNLIFSEMTRGSYNHLQREKISFMYTNDLYINIALSYGVLFVSTWFGCICTCPFLR